MNPPREISVISRKFDGSVSRSWKCVMASQTAAEIVLVGRFESEIEHPQLGIISVGTVSFEFFWFDRWYNIFRFHQPDWSIRNHYCNFAMPPKLSDGELSYVDLDIDVISWPDKSYEILDRDEFEENSIKFNYPKEVKLRSATVIEELLQMISEDKLP